MKPHLLPRRTVHPVATMFHPVRVLLVLAVAVLLVGTSPAFAQSASVFGNDASSGNPSSPLSANFKRASKVTLNERGTVVALSAYLQGTGPDATGRLPEQEVLLALYSDANGVPGTLLARTAQQSYSGNQQPGWITLDLLDNVVLDAGSYWIVIQTGATAGALVDFSNDTAPNWYGNADAIADGPSGQFGSGSAGTGTLLVKGYYLPQSVLSQFGRTAAAAAASSGLSADFKRGSQFTLSEQATLDTLSAYLDGNGGASGWQDVKMALYRDAGGVPGALVAQSQAPGRTIEAGSSARWYTFPTTNAPLQPGVYWIVLLSGGGSGEGSGTPGVVRDYGDGPADWYGNANTFPAGASNPFGTGTASGGTLSVYASFWHGITTKQFGQTQVGNTPSAGLTTNFIRGSFVTAPSSCTVTGFYAYLDGSGGVAGSQQLRVAEYITDNEGNPASLAGESTVVSIQAGMAPQWVYFPVSVPFFGEGNWLTIQSGDVGGIARDYGMVSGGSWIGAAAPFQAQAPATFPTPWSSSSTELSVYGVCTVAPFNPVPQN